MPASAILPAMLLKWWRTPLRTSSTPLIEQYAQLFKTGARTPVLRRPSDIGLDYEDAFFQSLDGIPLEGWFIPADSDKLLIVNHPTDAACAPPRSNQIGRDCQDSFERQNKIGSVHECSWTEKEGVSRSPPRIRLLLFPCSSSLRLPTGGKV
jgi:hypothetical protein